MELGGKLLVITRKHPTMKVHVLDPFCRARVTDKTLSGQLYRGELYRGEFYRGDKNPVGVMRYLEFPRVARVDCGSVWGGDK